MASRKKFFMLPAVWLLATLWLNTAHSQDSWRSCASLSGDAVRLACYDGFAKSLDAPGVQDKAADAAMARIVFSRPPTTGSLLGQAWELDANEKGSPFSITAHRPSYFLFAQHTSNQNTSPFSPAPGHSLPAPLSLDATEAKFQISAKAQLLQNIAYGNLDLWFAYTQASNWQIYNSRGSAPFRETDYEPEFILTLRTDKNVLGMNWRMLNLGFSHQSNGRVNPLSRSWNRLYAQFGLERGNFYVLARPWWRVPESASRDDNPDIGKYLGNGDMLAVYRTGEHVFSALGRYSFSGRRGAVEADWAFPITGALKGYVRIFSGYGENLLDYNHRQTTLGAGLAISTW